MKPLNPKKKKKNHMNKHLANIRQTFMFMFVNHNTVCKENLC